MKASYNIFIVDDHVMIRTALKDMIEKSGPYTVTEEFSNGKELVHAFPFKNEPDLLILDLSMPEMNGAQVIEWMKEKELDIKTLVLTLETKDDWVIKLFRMGIRGYLHKRSPASELQKAIDEVIQTGYYHNETTSKLLMAGEKKTEQELIREKITDRELHFLQLVCSPEEYTYEQMTSIMNVHRRTIDGYRESLFDKFNIKSKPGLVLFAIRHQLVDI